MTKTTPKSTIKNRNIYHPGPTYESGPLLTKQSFREACDINFIVKQHASTGVLTHLNPIQPTYGDNGPAIDLQASIQAVRDAQLEFDSLPAAVRQAAQNSPVQLLEMLGDEGAFQHLVEVGLPVDSPPPDLAGAPPGQVGPPPSTAGTPPAPPPAEPSKPTESISTT